MLEKSSVFWRVERSFDAEDDLPGMKKNALPSLFGSEKPFIAPAQSDAEWMFKKLQKQIEQCEDELNSDQELKVKLAGYEHLSVEALGFHGMDMVVFTCRDSENNPFRVCMHVSQVNIQLEPIRCLTESPRRIGFWNS